MKRPAAKPSKSLVKATTPRCKFQAHIAAHNLLRDKTLCLKLKRVDDPQPQPKTRATEVKKSGAPNVAKTRSRKTTIRDVKALCPKRVVIKLARVRVADKSKKSAVPKMAPPKNPIRRRARQI